MSESTEEFFDTLAKVLLRCAIFGLLLLLFSFGAFMLGGSVIDRVHGEMFGLSEHELNLIIYCGLGMFKLSVILMFFFPWLAIRLVLRKAKM